MGDISKNFNRKEFACKCGCGFDTVDVKLVEVLQGLRNEFGKSVNVTSGCRCVDHNEKVGGSNKSQHTKGMAADIVVTGVGSDEVYAWLDEKYPNELGCGKYSGWTHVDTRSNGPARW